MVHVRNSIVLIGAFIAGFLVFAACSGSVGLVGDATSESAESTALPEPDQAEEAEEGAQDSEGRDTPSIDSPPTPRDVPPLVLPAGGPGSDDEYELLIADLDRFVTDDQRLAGVPWPDLRNPDPVAAYRSCAEFQNWMSENNPTPTLVEAYTAPASPERGWDLELFSLYRDLGVVSTPSSPPYVMRVEDLVHPAATGITDALLGDVPPGSAAVVYWDSVGVSQLVDPAGNVHSTSPGWVDEGPWVAIMAPTDVGWQVWWDELTDPPPPGTDDGRGVPNDPPTRQDV